MPAKRYLMTPGPTPVPPQVLAAMAEPMIHHRAADFRKHYGECLARLKQVTCTESDVLLFTASGTGAFESAVVNLCAPGERVVAVTAGSFGVEKVFVNGTLVIENGLPTGNTPGTLLKSGVDTYTVATS